LQTAGHVVEPVTLSLLKHLLPTYYVLTTAEASSNLSRFDGVRYGYRATKEVTDLISMYKKSRTEGFGPEVRKRILLGTFVLSASYYDAYYTKAQKVRRLVRDETERVFAQYDFLMMPTTPTSAFILGEKSARSRTDSAGDGLAAANPLQMYLADIFTVQANVTGYPAISIPNGTDPNGDGPALPIGLQLMAPPFQERALVTMAEAYLKLV
jgi:aspartyl-tRNA(Asn)/glutamyl-tRNA(Gln) amidotransferase subunit A